MSTGAGKSKKLVDITTIGNEQLRKLASIVTKDRYVEACVNQHIYYKLYDDKGVEIDVVVSLDSESRAVLTQFYRDLYDIHMNLQDKKKE